jgi:hypothetical protein
LLQAKATLAGVHAEQARRHLQHQIGRYALTAEAEAEWARTLGDLILAIEGAFPDLAASVGNDRQTIIKIRAWWRALRLDLAKRNAEQAASFPEFVADEAI